MSETKTTIGGIGFDGALAIVFITLKLLGKINWPWVWVLSPLWILFVIAIFIIIIILIVTFIVTLING